MIIKPMLGLAPTSVKSAAVSDSDCFVLGARDGDFTQSEKEDTENNLSRWNETEACAQKLKTICTR